MSVEEGAGTLLITYGGHRVAALHGEGGQGALTLHDNGGTLSAYLTALAGGKGALGLYRGEHLAADLGPGNRDEMALRLFNGTGTQIAAVGGSPNNDGGALRIFGASGQPNVSLDAFDSGGAVNVYGASSGTPLASLGVEAQRSSGIVAVYNNSTPIAYLSRSSGGDGGNVTVAMNDGFGVFSAGAAQDGSGEACVNRRTQAGTERLACVGLGLPSAGMGK
jgi:hypothetical protein